MNNTFGNIISAARRNAGLSQEKAAEKLNVVVRTLAYYENGYRHVPDDIAMNMAKIYGNSALPYLWITHCTSCGSEILPQITDRPLSENILDTLAGIENMQKKTPTLIDIGRDGVIDEDESNIFKKLVMTCFMPIAKCMLALSLTNVPNKKAADAGTSTAQVKIM